MAAGTTRALVAIDRDLPLLDDDDPLVRARWMADTLGPWHKADSFAARLLGTQPLTIRIDLEPTGTGQPAKP